MSAATRRRPYPGAEKFIPANAGATLKQLAEASQGCRGCDLYKNATQAVFGEGPAGATVMLVGEQPGDQEDKQGHPFVGPAGALLRRALAKAGIDPATVYVTNVVKHFKWTAAPRGKRRIHSKPSAAQQQACRPWLQREIEVVRPRVLVLLGATAAQSLLGAAFRVSTQRGKAITGTRWAATVIATVHPSSVLRAPDDTSRHEQFVELVKDLRVAAKQVETRSR